MVKDYEVKIETVTHGFNHIRRYGLVSDQQLGASSTGARLVLVRGG
jgi:hypothetical protein